MSPPGPDLPGAGLAGPETMLADGGGLHDDADHARPRARKAPNAFRTISEVADDLHIPQHVVRFWETKFTQVRPLKRGGGRRYYRPDDILLLRRISDLLYIQGYTIKGVQRLLREGGGRLSDNIPPPSPEEREAAEAERALPDAAPSAATEPELPMPGLLPPAQGQQVARVAVRPKVEPETERLRAALLEALAALEALRARLG